MASFSRFPNDLTCIVLPGNMTKGGNFYIGSSGVVVPIPQSGYPEAFQGKSRLNYYSNLLNSV